MATAGAERRGARRFTVRGCIRIRRASGRSEVLQPSDVSRGGISFESVRRYDVGETVWVNLHYEHDAADRGRPGTETRCSIISAERLPRWDATRYRAKFEVTERRRARRG